MKHWAPLDVRDFRQFCASQKEFLLFGHSLAFSWLPAELLRDGWSLTVAAQIGNNFLYRVTRPHNERAAFTTRGALLGSAALVHRRSLGTIDAAT